ncbi:MAG: hypothetical protein QXX35_01560 [Desulfurococcaceae archaeon]
MKGISPLVATAILLVVTIAGGVLIYNYVINSLSSAEHFASLNIVSSKMLVLENSTIVNIRVSNIGTKTAIVEKITILPVNLSRNINIEVEPGVTKSINIVFDQVFNPSSKYYVIIVYDQGETEPYPVSLIK